MRNFNHWTWLNSIRLKLKINKIERLKLLDVIVEMGTMTDRTNQVDVQDFFANFLEECGIVAQYTMPETPSQNGVIAR